MLWFTWLVGFIAAFLMFFAEVVAAHCSVEWDC